MFSIIKSVLENMVSLALLAEPNKNHQWDTIRIGVSKLHIILRGLQENTKFKLRFQKQLRLILTKKMRHFATGVRAFDGQ